MEKPLDILQNLLAVNRYRKDRNYGKALQTGLSILEEYDESSDIFRLISDLYFSLGMNIPQESEENYQRAIYWLEKAIDKDKQNTHLHTKLGEIYWLAFADYHSAEVEFYKALEYDSNNRTANIHIAALYGPPDSNITLDEAIKHLIRAIELEPNDPNIFARLGELLYEKGDIEGAHKTWLKALTCNGPLDDGYSSFISEHV